MKQKKNKYFIAALIVLSVVLIAVTLFFSRENNQVPSFEVGTPWQHPMPVPTRRLTPSTVHAPRRIASRTSARVTSSQQQMISP